jgi:hypothetical protein
MAALISWKRVDGTLVSSDSQFHIYSTETGYVLYRNGKHFGHCIRQKDAKKVAQRLVDGLNNLYF